MDDSDRLYGVVPSEKIQDAYWKVVSDTLREVFGADDDTAAELVDRLRGHLRASARDSGDGVTGKMYQTEPFTVAADLSSHGHRPVTPEEIAEYLTIKSRYPAMSATEIAEISQIELQYGTAIA